MKKVLKWVGVVIAVLIVIGFIAGKDNDSSSKTASSKNNIQLTDNESNVIQNIIRKDVNLGFNGGDSKLNTEYLVVTAKEMEDVYSSNQARGDKSYNDKKIIVSGIVASIDSSIGDIPFVTLKTNNMFNRVHINFAKEYRDLAADLDKNQKVRYACIGNGVMLGSPSLNECKPVSTAEDELVNKLVASVEKAIQKPAKASDNEKKLILFAKVASVVTDDFKTCDVKNVDCISASISKYNKDNLNNNEKIKEITKELGLTTENL
jgi:hypothetical protein